MSRWLQYLRPIMLNSMIGMLWLACFSCALMPFFFAIVWPIVMLFGVLMLTLTLREAAGSPWGIAPCQGRP